MLNSFDIFSNEIMDNKVQPKHTNTLRYNSNPKQLAASSFSPSLNQGSHFNKYKTQKNNRITTKLGYLDNSNMREGFTNNNSQQASNDTQGSLTSETNEIIQKNDLTNEQEKISILRKLYENTIEQYQLLSTQISENINGYVDRVSKENSYLNKVVQFKTGEICYVTKQGVVKPIHSKEVWDTLNISHDVQINLDIPWSKQYNIPRVPIPTTPPLVSGTPVINGQSLGNEGSNVYVNQLLPSNIEPTYMGCYAANEDNNNMTFLGTPPLDDVTIENGNFAQPVLDNNKFKYITSASEVPGWYFGNAVLINNSTSWGYKMPYPSGNQCVSIQKTNYMYTTLTLNTGVDYTISFSACSRDCCMDKNVGNPVELKLHTNLDAFISSIETITPSPINTWVDYNITFTVPTTQTYRLYFSGTYNAGDQSTAIANVQLNSKLGESAKLYSYEDCKQSAIMSGYQFFGLQNVNTNTGKGYCVASNSNPAVTEFGESTVVSKQIALWSSETSGDGNTASFIDNTLQVIDANGISIYSTTVPESTKSEPNPYVGCYSFKEIKENNIPQLGNPWDYTMNSCMDEATNQGYKYVGIGGPHRDSTEKDNDQTRRCLAFNDLKSAQMKGPSNKCDNPYGSNRVAAIYETTNLEDSNGNSYLILQDDGNLVIYPGASPTDKQGDALWAAGTYQKQQSPNSNMTAIKNKYGKNWVSSGATLAPNEFISSNDGSIALIMQTDGNLVLYTFETSTNCQKMSDGNMGAGVGGNAVYDIGMKSFKNNMGNLAYIDENSNLYMYPKENLEYTNTYTMVKNADTINNNISGASFSDATLESCQNACNDNNECAGFVLDGNNCYPKTNQMYPYEGTYSSKTDSNIYIRNKQPINPPLGVSFNTNGVDSAMYQNYINKGNIGNEYGLPIANSVQKQQLDNLQGRIKQISGEINKYTGEFSSGANSANKQLDKNSDGANKYITDLTNINQQINYMKKENNMNNILEDSDIVVLQKNYNYLFWSVLAAGTVLVTMSVAKK